MWPLCHHAACAGPLYPQSGATVWFQLPGAAGAAPAPSAMAKSGSNPRLDPARASFIPLRCF